MQEIINSFGIDWKIFTAEVVNFLVVVAILYFFVFKKIFKKLDERREVIAHGIKKSQKAEETLKKAEEEKAEIIKEAREEASQKIQQAVELAKEKEDKITSEAKEKAENIIDKSQREAEERKKEIISSADKEIAKMAILGAEKILSEKN